MALRNQPYIPLYIQDFLTDEKLIECSASAHGVYIRIMCIMHKSEEYGTILLRQIDKQNDQQIKNFATKLAKHLPFKEEVIFAGISELVEYGVLKIDGDKLIQSRMIRDNQLSVKRSKSGTKGGFATAKRLANFENEYESENEVENTINKRKKEFEDEVGKNLSDKYDDEMLKDFARYWTEHNPGARIMRFEMAKNQPFDISRRLVTWKKNNDTGFGKNPTKKPIKYT